MKNWRSKRWKLSEQKQWWMHALRAVNAPHMHFSFWSLAPSSVGTEWVIIFYLLFNSKKGRLLISEFHFYFVFSAKRRGTKPSKGRIKQAKRGRNQTRGRGKSRKLFLLFPSCDTNLSLTTGVDLFLCILDVTALLEWILFSVFPATSGKWKLGKQRARGHFMTLVKVDRTRFELNHEGVRLKGQPFENVFSSLFIFIRLWINSLLHCLHAWALASSKLLFIFVRFSLSSSISSIG